MPEGSDTAAIVVGRDVLFEADCTVTDQPATVDVPRGAQPLSARLKDPKTIAVTFKAQLSQPFAPRLVHMLHAGAEVPEVSYYVGFVDDPNSVLNWHVFIDW